MTVLSSSSITGDKVVNASGDSLGEIKDLMVDLNTGQVSYAVLEFGGFLGMGSKLFAVPLNAMQVDTENKRFVFNHTKESLENAPGFDKDNWPDFADPTFTESVNKYYSTTPPVIN